MAASIKQLERGEKIQEKGKWGDRLWKWEWQCSSLFRKTKASRHVWRNWRTKRVKAVSAQTNKWKKRTGWESECSEMERKGPATAGSRGVEADTKTFCIHSVIKNQQSAPLHAPLWINRDTFNRWSPTVHPFILSHPLKHLVLGLEALLLQTGVLLPPCPQTLLHFSSGEVKVQLAIRCCRGRVADGCGGADDSRFWFRFCRYGGWFRGCHWGWFWFRLLVRENDEDLGTLPFGCSMLLYIRNASFRLFSVALRPQRP